MTDPTVVLTVWLAVLTGSATVAGTLYGVYLAHKQRRRDGAVRMQGWADAAVRRTEATFVRPIIRQRMLYVLAVEGSAEAAAESDALRRRVRLFVALEQGLRLTESEKAAAHRSATNHLVALMRNAPDPPLRVDGEERLRRHAVHISGLVEAAYGLRPRVASEAIRSLGEFCRGVADNPDFQRARVLPRVPSHQGTHPSEPSPIIGGMWV